MLKKIYDFLRSMKFGMVLLVIIAALCIVATTPDNEGIYSTWYFITLFCLLALNLTFCSVVRVTKIPKWKQALLSRAERSDAVLQTRDNEKWLKDHHFRKSGKIYTKNSIGFTGTFFTHLSMLLMTIAAGALFAFAQVEDISVFPEETHTMPDGTTVCVEDFSLVDETGAVEYKSVLRGVLPNGTEVTGETRVNYPMKIGQYKIYQQSYAYVVPVGVRTSPDAEEEFALLDETAFLTLDDEDGIYFSQIFTNVEEDENGTIQVSTSGDMINPGYEVGVTDNGEESSGIVYPGTTLTAGGVYYTFYAPEAYPGLRFKTQPTWAIVLLYISFVLMLGGLFFCFFTVPEAAFLRKDGIAIVGQKDISQRIEFYRADAEDP